MPRTDTQSPIWSYAPPVAQLTCGALAAEVNPERPQLGLQRPSWRAKPLATQLLGVRWESGKDTAVRGGDALWPMRLAEAYVRAGDLVATYLTEPAWPYRPQIYWQTDVLSGVPQVLASLSLIVSIQTDLLDTRPRLGVASQMPADELVHVAVNSQGHSAQSLTVAKRHVLEPEAKLQGILVRLPGGEASYVECAPASDFREVRVSPAHDESEGAKLEWQLFDEFLEKGVIRRARVHAFFLPREDDVRLAAECARALATRPLPLTA